MTEQYDTEYELCVTPLQGSLVPAKVYKGKKMKRRVLACAYSSHGTGAEETHAEEPTANRNNSQAPQNTEEMFAATAAML